MSTASEAIHRYWTETADVTDVTQKKRLFLVGFAERGVIKGGLIAADISRNTAYVWRNLDPEFRQAWDEVRENARDEVRESIYDQAVSRKNIVASIFYAKHNCPEYKERTEIDVQVVHRQVEERLEQYRQQLALPPASTKDIINSVLGFTGGDTSQPVAAPTTNDNHHD
jgi:hypothetical protein